MEKLKSNTVTVVTSAFEKFKSAVTDVLKGMKATENKWVKCAEMSLALYGSKNENLFLLANVTTARGKILGKGYTAEDIKGWKTDMKTLRETVEGIAESLELSNPRRCWFLMLEQMQKLSGLENYKHLTKEKTPTDKVLSAFKIIENNLHETELPVSVQDDIQKILEELYILELLKEKKS